MTTRYRIIDPYTSEGEPRVEEWLVVSKTLEGAWVVPRDLTYRTVEALRELPVKTLREEFGARFVLDGEGKRHCHETMEMARESYRRRKLSQISHAKASITRAELALAWLEGKKPPQPDVFQFFIGDTVG